MRNTILEKYLVYALFLLANILFLYGMTHVEGWFSYGSGTLVFFSYNMVLTLLVWIFLPNSRPGVFQEKRE